MKKGFVFLSLAISLLIASTVEAQEKERKHAVGIRISSQDAVINNSISYKYFFNPSLAVEGLFSFGDPVAIGALLEKHKPIGTAGLSWYAGGGAYVGFGGGRNFGVQGVAGLDFIFPTFPVNLSVDWKPELNITKQFSFEPAAVGFSARFVF
jgi:hypothetical protein